MDGATCPGAARRLDGMNPQRSAFSPFATEGFMERTAATEPSLTIRAWTAWQTRGADYAWHKLLRRSLRCCPTWKRRWLYYDPRRYWTHRGGADYFCEQEGQPARTRRAEWIADRLASYRPRSILEVGCGYGKLLYELRRRIDVPLLGVDFSATQLHQARHYLADADDVGILLSRGERLPLPDGAFDMVVTSAVILHNPPPVAELIRQEIVRVARRFAAHNEETDRSYNRYGYDTAAWYRARGIRLAESGLIPVDPDPRSSQFCVAVLSARH
jgi:SAM-dependent methyltransferase